MSDWPKNEESKILSAMALWYQRQVTLTFQVEGARDGLPKWAPRALSTVVTPAGTWRIAYGTDMVPRLNRQQYNDARAEAMDIGWWKFGQKGKFRGYEGVRRYRGIHPVMQVSQGLKAMFSQIRKQQDRVFVGAPRLIRVGKKYMEAAELISATDNRPARPVLTVTENDRKNLANVVKLSLYQVIHKR